MNVLADVGQVAQGPEQVVAEVDRVAGDEPQPPQALDARDARQQVAEAHGPPAAAPRVAVDRLAEEGDLRPARLDQAADLLDDPLRPAADLRAANVGHDAVRAELVAPAHHADERLGRPRPGRGVAGQIERVDVGRAGAGGGAAATPGRSLVTAERAVARPAAPWRSPVGVQCHAAVPLGRGGEQIRQAGKLPG